MGTTTLINGYPVPAGSDPNNIPADLAALVAVLEQGSTLKRLTQAQIDALTSAQKPNGLLVVNITTGRLQMSDGSAFKNISGITINDDGSIVVKSVIVKDGTAEALRLWLNGGTAMVDSGVAGRPLRLTSGLTTIALTYGSGATLSPQTAPGDGPSNLVTKGYVDALGTPSDWSPVLTQGVVVAATVTAARVVRNGKVCTVFGSLAVTGTGTAGQLITLSLPVAPAAASRGGGMFWHFDPGATNHVGFADVTSSGLRFFKDGDGNPHGQNAGQLTAGDTFSFSVTYETA